MADLPVELGKSSACHGARMRNVWQGVHLFEISKIYEMIGCFWRSLGGAISRVLWGIHSFHLYSNLKYNFS